METEKNPPVIKDQETQRIRQKIIEAASDLFEKKGLYETSVAEVAEAAGISPPVTYHYLNRKSDIMLLIMEYFSDQFKDRVMPRLDRLQDTEDRLQAAIQVFFELVDEHLVKVVLVYRESRTLDRTGRSRIMASEISHHGIFKELIDEGVEKGVFRPLDTDLAAYNIIAAGHTWALKSWHFRKKMDLQEYIRRQTEFILAALRP